MADSLVLETIFLFRGVTWVTGGGRGGVGRVTRRPFLVDREGSGPGWLDGWITGCRYKAKVLFYIVKAMVLKSHCKQYSLYDVFLKIIINK